MRSDGWPNRSSFSELLGFHLVSREDGAATVGVDVRAEHANTVGIAHGGLLSSLMDTACGAALAYQPSVGGRGVTTVSFQVTYLGATFVGDRVTATARRRGGGRRLVTLVVDAQNQAGEPLAVGLCTLRIRSGEGALKRRGAAE